MKNNKKNLIIKGTLVSILAMNGVGLLNPMNLFALGTNVAVYFDKDVYKPGEHIGITVSYENSEPALIQVNLQGENITLNGGTTKATTQWEKSGSFRLTGTVGSEGSVSVKAVVAELVNKDDKVVSGMQAVGRAKVEKEKPVVEEKKKGETTKPTTNTTENKPQEKPRVDNTTNNNNTKNNTSVDTNSGVNVSVAPPIPEYKEEKPTIREVESKSKNNYLKEIKVENGKLQGEFNKETLTYSFEIGKESDEIKLTFVKEDDKATLDMETLTLKVGETKKVIVTAEDGSTREYTFIGKENKEGKLFDIYINDRLEKIFGRYHSKSIVLPKKEVKVNDEKPYTVNYYQDYILIEAQDPNLDKEAKIYYYDTKTKHIYPYIEIKNGNKLYANTPLFKVDMQGSSVQDFKYDTYNFEGRTIKVLVTDRDKDVIGLDVLDVNGKRSILLYNTKTQKYQTIDDWRIEKGLKVEDNTMWIVGILLGVAALLTGILSFVLFKKKEIIKKWVSKK